MQMFRAVRRSKLQVNSSTTSVTGLPLGSAVPLVMPRRICRASPNRNRSPSERLVTGRSHAGALPSPTCVSTPIKNSARQSPGTPSVTASIIAIDVSLSQASPKTASPKVRVASLVFPLPLAPTIAPIIQSPAKRSWLSKSTLVLPVVHGFSPRSPSVPSISRVRNDALPQASSRSLVSKFAFIPLSTLLHNIRRLHAIPCSRSRFSICCCTASLSHSTITSHSRFRFGRFGFTQRFGRFAPTQSPIAFFFAMLRPPFFFSITSLHPSLTNECYTGVH